MFLFEKNCSCSAAFFLLLFGTLAFVENLDVGFWKQEKTRNRDEKRNYAVRKTCCFMGLLGLLLALAGCSSFTADSYNAEGVRLLGACRTEDALDCFEQAKNADPNNPDAYYNCGVVYHEMAIETGRESDFEMARYYYDMCLERNPNHVDCNRSKATLLCDIGESDHAFQMLQAWVNREPASAEPRVELARLYDEHNQLGQARDCLNDAIAIDSRNVRAYTALGSVRERMGESTEALRAYEQALALNPNQPEINDRIAALRYTTPATTPATPTTPETAPSITPSEKKEVIATGPDGTIQ